MSIGGFLYIYRGLRFECVLFASSRSGFPLYSANPP